MSLLRWPRNRWWVGIAVLALLTIAAVRLCAAGHADMPEIALVIGEPYEDMRKRSSAKIDPAIPGHFWGNLPKADTRLRFADPEYGFITPVARFFAVTFDETGLVNSVRMSPQIEPLSLDEALKVALDLQQQWRDHGWKQLRTKEWPAYADTKEVRDMLHACKASSVYWQAGDKYQTMLSIACFSDDRHPNEKRYLITLSVAKPWVE